MKTDDLLFTIEICRKYLPDDTHPVHYDRLDAIESMIRKNEGLKEMVRRSIIEKNGLR